MRSVNISSIRTVDRAIDVLNVFTPEKPILTIDEIAQATRLPKATVYRLLYTMERRGLIQYHPETLQYKIGLKMLEYAGLVTGTLDVRKESEDLLDDLHMKTRQSVLMAVPDNDSIVYVFKREKPEGLKYSSFVGQRRPLNYGVMGRIIMAYLPKERLTSIMRKYPAPPWMEEGETVDDTIRINFDTVKKELVCVDINKTNDGVAGIGAPIFNAEGKLIAALALIGPTVQLVDDEFDRKKEFVKEAARQISRRMGYPDDAYAPTGL